MSPSLLTPAAACPKAAGAGRAWLGVAWSAMLVLAQPTTSRAAFSTSLAGRRRGIDDCAPSRRRR
eukprot:CAMPEP_0176185816 /NCGR_PEP_ID=MMETSP0121_2-20121125/1550_1 /TAXON_ID=160619 /ORGANISM="Kryptoperidinium foliaceum, Strain CCMP 1326" /LENGTH=64 /DNA_ID=CAMNT_0017524283 /DNA_START=114 /DNA_END=304 /DNA_ORIENTATION=+